MRFRRKPPLPYQEILKDVGVPGRKIKRCMKWAFGKKWETIAIYGCPQRWNSLHGNIFIMKIENSIEEDLKKIGRAFLKQEE